MKNLQIIEGFDSRQLIEDAWLGVIAKENTLFNPLTNPHDLVKDRPELYYTYLLSRPEYLGFAAKVLLGIDLAPFQSVILSEMWNHRFPMLIATRGGGKAQPLYSKILSESGWTTMGQIAIGDKIYGSNGQLCLVEDIFPQGEKEIYEVKLEDGRKVECCSEHLWAVRLNGEDQVITTLEMAENEHVYIKNCDPIQFQKNKLPLSPYVLGKLLFNQTFKDGIFSDKENSLTKIGFNTSNKTTFIPDSYKYSSILDRRKLMRGILEEIGRNLDGLTILPLEGESRRLILDILEVLRSLGITAQLKGRTITINNLSPIFKRDAPPQYVLVKSVKATGKFTEMQCIRVNSPDNTYITDDYVVTHNTFMLGVYSLLRTLLIPNRKVVIVGSVFRQSKLTFGYIKEIYDRSAILRSICPSPPQFLNDRCIFSVGSSTITAIPIGNTGDKVRGLRASEIFADEFSTQSEEIFETVISGFTAVSNDPIGKVKRRASEAFANQLGLELEKEEDEYSVGNQIVITGTAYYHFNHFYRYWRRWHDIITSRGDKKILKDLLGEIPEEGFDWRDYSIVRLPASLLPPSFMDASQLARAKATITSDRYQNEYGACFKSDTEVITKNGIKLITEVEPGDEVLTHRNRFRKVLRRTTRHYEGNMVELKAYGYGKPVHFTEDHLFYNDGHFSPISELDYTEFCPNLETSGDKYINLFHKKPTFNKEDVPIDYNLGVACAYYAAVGVPTYKGVLFKYPEEEQERLDVVDGAFSSILGMNVKFSSSNGLSSITVNHQTDLSEFFKWAADKHVRPYLLFSNDDFLRGFIVGIIKSIGNEGKALTVKSENEQLIYQLKASCDYFNFPSLINFYDYKDGRRLYNFSITSDNYVRLRNFLFDEENEYRKGNGAKNGTLIKDRRNILHKIQYKKVYEYSGQVHCLEIAEDNSFSLPFATVHNCFSKDSDGFFKASLLEKCTANEVNNIVHGDGPVVFEAQAKGDINKRYVFGVDPASEKDRFAVVVIELNPDHRRIVHVWTTNSEDFKKKRRAGVVEENDFYGYVCRKIRDLMIDFPCEHISIDSQGGGKAVYEAFHDRGKLKKGEQLLWETIDPLKPKDSDGETGLHIIELVNFASADWTSSSNHLLKKDFEDRVLLFPKFSSSLLAIASATSEDDLGIYDTMEDALIEIEELKKELTQIVVTQTANGRERWDTPDNKLPGQSKGRLTKDRYSALLMANAAARKLCGPSAESRVDMSSFMDNQTSSTSDYLGPVWATSKLAGLYDDLDEIGT